MQVEVSSPSGPKNHNHGGMIVFVVLAITVIAAVFYSGGVIPEVQKMYFLKDVQGVPVQQDNYASSSGIQIDTLKFVTITPGPSITIPPGANPTTPTITQPPTCTDDVAVDLLIDTSNSMVGNKMTQLKAGLAAFTSKLSDSSIIGIQSFSGTTRARVAIQPYRDNKSEVQSLVQNLGVDNVPGTNTRDAFELAKEKIASAQQAYPGKHFKLILFTDGIPESSDYTTPCSLYYNQTGQLPGECARYCKPAPPRFTCFSPSQNPASDPNIADRIKALGVDIYAIALLDSSDTRFDADLDNLLNNVASSPDKVYKTSNPADIDNIYNQISEKVCNN